MNRLWYAALASGILATANGQPPASSISSRTAFDWEIPVHLYNLSGIPAHTLDRAVREASTVFAQAGVNILWEAGDPRAEEAHSTDQSAPSWLRDQHVRGHLAVRIVRGMAVHVPSGALGVSLPYAQFGVSATIFQERVENLCAAARQDFAVLLGHAIAHELGHVVLRSHGHAPAGIMRATWGKAELEQATTGHLGFTAQQGAEIRDYVLRQDSQGASEVAERKTQTRPQPRYSREGDMQFQFTALTLTAFAKPRFGHSMETVDIYVSNRDDSARLLGPGAPLASGIFKKIGVRLNWHKGEIRPAANSLAICTLEFAPESATPEALAASRLLDSSRIEITVYKDRLQRFLDGHRTLAGVAVGYVLAHELAHVMQGAPRHSDSGILKAHWSDQDFSDMVFHKLVFTATDVELIHKGLSFSRHRPFAVFQPPATLR